MSESPDAVRNLAAWGYQSSRTGTRVEVDVWTINDVDAEEDAVERARRLLSDGVTVLDAAGDVAKVEYPGAAGVGYRRVSTDAKVSQQAYAGAARSAGGTRTEAGTFDDGWTVPDDAPDHEAVVDYGEAVVLPAVEQDLRRSGSPELAREVASMTRDGTREEIEEPVRARPFTGYRNAVRIYPRNGGAFEYDVDTSADSMTREGGPT
jgi:hypothetical protein